MCTTHHVLLDSLYGGLKTPKSNQSPQSENRTDFLNAFPIYVCIPLYVTIK